MIRAVSELIIAILIGKPFLKKNLNVLCLTLKKKVGLDVKYIVLGNIVSDKYDIKGFEKREIK